MSPTMKIAFGSIVVGLLVLELKTIAYMMTGSIALLSDAMESTVNVATAIAALVAIHVASLPPDQNHPYGHHKAEFLSAVLEGVMIIIAAVLILVEAFKGFLLPRALDPSFPGLAVNVLASAINGAWCWLLLRRGRALKSPALVADGHHLLSDVVSSLGVTIGVLLAFWTGWALLDPALAALVALNIIVSGWKVMKASLSGLLDEAVPDETLREVERVIAATAVGAVQAHDLRTRHAGQITFIEFHLVMPGDMTVIDAHSVCDEIETALKAAVPGSRVTIHVEPEHKAKAQEDGAIPTDAA